VTVEALSNLPAFFFILAQMLDVPPDPPGSSQRHDYTDDEIEPME
jgi:hypothetical protein